MKSTLMRVLERERGLFAGALIVRLPSSAAKLVPMTPASRPMTVPPIMT